MRVLTVLRRRPARIRPVPVLVVAIVLAAAVALAGWYGDHRAGQRDQAVRQALATAPAAAQGEEAAAGETTPQHHPGPGGGHHDQRGQQEGDAHTVHPAAIMA
ncbi:hypothetical protein [Micromonospora sp. SL4-19]|uniref:hypothetical protein n=1 Tax=Micromonospora sp. SL4-19 TaxID=3399129 RepID=UPI003A4D7BD0